MKTVLFLLRAATDRPPPQYVRETDRIVALDETTPETVLELVFSHDTVVVW